jgi:hypothetical protein
MRSLLLATLIGCGGDRVGPGYCIPDDIPRNIVETYVTTNLTSIRADLELGLDFVFQHNITVIFDLSTEKNGQDLNGHFDYTNNNITLFTGHDGAPGQWANLLNDFVVFPSRLEYKADQRTRHELGHQYVQQVCDEEGIDCDWFIGLPITDDEVFTHSMLHEGIAQYISYQQAYSNLTEQWACAFPDSKLNTTRYQDRQRARYEVGLALVGPILEEYGINEGTRYLLQNPPDPAELNDLLTYQQGALVDLAQ